MIVLFKPETTTDVFVLLTRALNVKTVTSQLRVLKGKGKAEAIVKPKTRLNYMVWLKIHERIKSLGGKWHVKESVWTVPLTRA